jgi:hypothetical protein
MGLDWDDFLPGWVRDNRTGPGPLAPRYAKRGEAARRYKASNGGGDKPKPKCCPMVAAVVSVKQGRFRAARLYTKKALRLA